MQKILILFVLGLTGSAALAGETSKKVLVEPEVIGAWYLSAEAIVWTKEEDGAANRALLNEATPPNNQIEPNGPVFLTSEQFAEHDYEASLRLTAGYWFDRSHGVELSYAGFGLLQFENGAFFDTRIPGSSNPDFYDQGGFVNDWDNIDSFQVDFKTDLHVAEANFMWQYDDHLTFVGGLRFIGILDSVDIGADNNTQVPQSFYNQDTDNYMIGVQGGVKGRFDIGSGFSVGYKVLGALLANYIEQTITVEDEPGSAPVFPVSTSEETVDFAVAGDLGIDVEYKINDHIDIFAGYEALMIQGVAGGLENIDRRNPNIVSDYGQDINSDSFQIYHGAKAGIRIWID